MGLTINFAKTKVTSQGGGGGETIEHVSEYRYLGQILSFSDKTGKELKIRHANSWKAFWALKYILKSKIKLKTKIRIILESTVIPVLFKN